jgi:hypothetical protein
MNKSYLRTSYTFNVFTEVVSTAGIFLADLTMSSSFSLITIKAFLSTFKLLRILAISFVFGWSNSNSFNTIISLFKTFEDKALFIAALLTFLGTL